MPSDSLVSLSPPETLSFRLSRSSECREILKVTNTSNSKIAFKVKTTQPSWYYVRPNQQVLGAGQTENVVIVLVETEGVRLLDLSDAKERMEKFEKHRFLVQTKIIEDSEYDKIVSLSPNDRGEEFTKIWATGLKDERKNIKLKVDFILDESRQSNPAELSKSAQDAIDSVDSVRAKISRSDIDSSSNSDVVISELLALRKKYDAVVEYTVHLTAERDAVVGQLEEIQKDYNREKQKKKSDSKNISNSKQGEKSQFKQGLVSFALVLIVAVLSFVIGKYVNM